VAVNEFLIDTNIYSHAMHADPAVVSLLRRASRIVLSSISIGELLSGFKGGIQERKNREELAEFLDTRRVSICGVSEDTAEFYAEILDGLRRSGTPIPTNDIWIAAQVMETGAELVSADEHFTQIDGIAWTHVTAG
jgi:tRNA(fMet)-specific endonuclease VapC